MAEINYNSYKEQSQASEKSYTNSQFEKIGYFNSLKDDGDEAIVRFLYTSPEEFNIASVHTVRVGDRWRKVSCNRNQFEPEEKCAFCANGEKPSYKFYVKLLEYVTDENGNIVQKGKIWERPASFANTLKTYFDEYGVLEDVVFKIKRRGAKGDLKTTYDIILANPKIYNNDVYAPASETLSKQIKTLDLSKHSYFIKTNEDIRAFLATNEFPSAKVEEATPEISNAFDRRMNEISSVTPEPTPVVDLKVSGLNVEPRATADSILGRQRRTFNY